jgi:dienelactone hydrolase
MTPCPGLHLYNPSGVSVFLIALALIGSANRGSAQTPTVDRVAWSGVRLGPHAIGYGAFTLRDASRTLRPDTSVPRRVVPRAIPVRVWYPARSDDVMPKVTFGDLLFVASRTTERDPLDARIDSALALRTRGLHSYSAQRYARAGGTALLARDTAGLVDLAFRAAITSARRTWRLPGRHPLVLFAGGTAHSVDENVALWELLASFGYVVAAIPTVAIDPAAEEVYQPADGVGLETIVQDLEAVLTNLLARAYVDSARIAGVGFSFGGAGVLTLAARNARIRAVVGLDPSFIAARHLPTIRQNPLFDARRLLVPILEIHRADTTVDLSLLEEAKRSARTSIELTGVDHIDFNSYVLLYGPLFRHNAPNASRDSAIAVKSDTYRAMIESIRHFLDSSLSVRRTSTGHVAPLAIRGEGPVWNAVPATSIRVRQWTATP